MKGKSLRTAIAYPGHGKDFMYDGDEHLHPSLTLRQPFDEQEAANMLVSMGNSRSGTPVFSPTPTGTRISPHHRGFRAGTATFAPISPHTTLMPDCRRYSIGALPTDRSPVGHLSPINRLSMSGSALAGPFKFIHQPQVNAASVNLMANFTKLTANSSANMMAASAAITQRATPAATLLPIMPINLEPKALAASIGLLSNTTTVVTTTTSAPIPSSTTDHYDSPTISSRGNGVRTDSLSGEYLYIYIYRCGSKQFLLTGV